MRIDEAAAYHARMYLGRVGCTVMVDDVVWVLGFEQGEALILEGREAGLHDEAMATEPASTQQPFGRPFVSSPHSSARFDPSTHRRPLPTAVDRRRVVWSYAITVGLYHLVALLAVLPWFFSWTGVVLAVVGIYVFGGLGINLCYHRLMTHRGLACPKWLEHGFAVLGFKQPVNDRSGSEAAIGR
jgi:hypothetical protein